MGKHAWFVDLQELLILVLRDDPVAHEKLIQWINSIPEEYLCCRGTAMLQTVADGYTFGAALEMIMGHNDHATAYLDHGLTLPHDQAYEHDPNNWFQRFHLLEWGYLPALNRAHLYRVAGDDMKADELMAQCIEYLAEVEKDFPELAGADYVRASMHALQGERDEALASLRMAIDNHWYRAWYAERDPNLASLRDDEEFKQIIEELNANLARMRENVQGAG